MIIFLNCPEQLINLVKNVILVVSFANLHKSLEQSKELKQIISDFMMMRFECGHDMKAKQIELILVLIKTVLNVFTYIFIQCKFITINIFQNKIFSYTNQENKIVHVGEIILFTFENCLFTRYANMG